MHPPVAEAFILTSLLIVSLKPFSRLRGIKTREMENHQIRTRAELQNRRSKKFSSKLSSDETKKSLKITKKSVNSAFTYVDKDALVDSSSYTFNGTPALEMSEDNQETESTENLLLGDVNSQLLSASPQASVTTDLTPCSVITTNDSEELFVLDGDWISEASKSEAEVDMVINYLKQVRVQMLSSTGNDLRLKKLLDALVEVTVKEFCSLPDDRDWMDELISAKNRILFICFLMCLIATAVIRLLRSGIGDSAYYRSPPT